MNIAPKLIHMRINNDHDDHLLNPFLTIQLESSPRRHLERGICKAFADKNGAFLQHMKHKFGTDLVLHRMGCLAALKSDEEFVNFEAEPVPKMKGSATLMGTDSIAMLLV